MKMRTSNAQLNLDSQSLLPYDCHRRGPQILLSSLPNEIASRKDICFYHETRVFLCFQYKYELKSRVTVLSNTLSALEFFVGQY